MNAIDRQFKGSILIFVDGYGVEEFRCIGHNNPDDFFFGESGWAVGNNPRDRYCARSSHDKIRHFNSFDEAVDYVYRKQRKRLGERFQLVYEIGNEWHRVSTMDDILAIDTELDAKQRETEKRRAHASQGYEILCKFAPPKMAADATMLLRVTLDNGEDTARSLFSKTAYSRLIKLLIEADLLPLKNSLS